jgi:hypothetical protein
MSLGILAALVGMGLLGYNHYIRSISENLYLVAFSLIIVGVFFYLFFERE